MRIENLNRDRRSSSITSFIVEYLYYNIRAVNSIHQIDKYRFYLIIRLNEEFPGGLFFFSNYLITTRWNVENQS